MSSTPRPSADGQLRRARTELENALRSGGNARAEALLETYPGIAEDTESALELVYTEFVCREELGQNPDPQEWYTRFPQWRDDLRQMFDVHEELKRDESRRNVRRSTVNLDSPTHGAASPRTSLIPDFEILTEVGRGGMGVVYKARQLSLNRVVALKVILSGLYASERERIRFRREAETAARLDHPNIVRIYEVGEVDGRAFCAMEFVDGATLGELLTGAPWSLQTASELIANLAAAANHAHERGVIHRDLKPSNILLVGARAPNSTDAGDDRTQVGSGSTQSSPTKPVQSTPKITDFGLAKSLTDSARGPTRTGDVVGTPTYMAPEQAEARNDQIGPPTDVWALGVILYEMLVGHPPFLGDTTVETLQLVRTTEPVPPRQRRPTIPRDLETICLKCLRKSPTDRYATAAALADDLSRWLRGESILARPVGRVQRFGLWCRRNPVVAGLSGAVAGLFLAALIASVVALVNLSEATEQAKLLAQHEGVNRQRAENELLAETARAREERRRVARIREADGSRLLQEGDWSGAAVLFATALADEPDPEAQWVHRVRLRAIFDASPKLTNVFHTVEDEHLLSRISGDGSRLLTVTPKESRSWDTDTGESRPSQVRNDPEYDLTKYLSPSTTPGATVDEATCFALSRDGRTTANILGGKVFAWDTTTGEALPLPLPPDRSSLPHPFHPNGSRFLQIIDPFLGIGLNSASGEVLAPSLSKFRPRFSHQFSPEGRWVASAAPQIGEIRFWDADTGQPTNRRFFHADNLNFLAFNPTGTAMVSQGMRTTQVWSLTSGTAIGARIAVGGSKIRPSFSADGAFFALGDNTGTTIQIWDLQKSLPVGGLLHHPLEVYWTRFCSDGEHLLTTTLDGTVRQWHFRTGQLVGPVLKGGVMSEYHPDGTRIIQTDGHTVRVWKRPVDRSETPFSSAMMFGVSWVSSLNAVLTSTTQIVQLWKPADGTLIREFPHPSPVYRHAISPDQTLLVTATRGEIRVWDLKNGQQIGRDIPVPAFVRCLAFTPSGQLVISGGPTEGVQFWDPRTGNQIRSFVDPDGRKEPTTPRTSLYEESGFFHGVSFDPTGERMLFTGGTDRVLWDVPAGRVISRFPDSEILSRPCLSPDGMHLWVVLHDGTAKQYRVRDGAPTGATISVGAWRFNATLSPDGKRLATVHTLFRSVQVWDLTTGQPIGTPIPFSAGGGVLNFSRDGRFLITRHANGIVHVWDVTTGLLAMPPLGAGKSLDLTEFAPDGHRLLALQANAPVLLWTLTPDERPIADLRADAELLANRKLDDRGVLAPLTRDEISARWAKFRIAAKRP